MKKALIIDLDNTLYDYTKADKIAMEAVVTAGAAEFSVSREEFLKAYMEARNVVKERHAKRASSHNRMLYAQMAAEMLGKSPMPVALTVYEAYWKAFFASMEVFDGVTEALTELKSRGVKLGICTDMLARVQFQKIRTLNLSRFFDAIVTSEEARDEKPSAVPVQMIMDKLKVRTGEAAFIGDGYEKDVLGAVYSGLHPIWFKGDLTRAENATVITSWRDSKLFELF
ncbi:MAG: HAD hydrolase-like protein [Selenomonadaceae bacterium]|nr:HAD hydrolase-like protein [Selenomonadaceae bacterium]